MERYYGRYNEHGKLELVIPGKIVHREAQRVFTETGIDISDFLLEVAENAFDYDCVYDGEVDLDAAEWAIITHASDYIDFWRNNQ